MCGPFRSGRPIKAPLWVAVFLKTQNKCRLHPPPWLEVDSLKKLLQQERLQENEEVFLDVPFHYVEIATALFDAAPDDIVNCHQVRSLFEDLLTLRQSKVRRSLRALTEYVDGVEVTNLSLMEVNLFRPVISETLNLLFAHSDSSSSRHPGSSAALETPVSAHRSGSVPNAGEPGSLLDFSSFGNGDLTTVEDEEHAASASSLVAAQVPLEESVPHSSSSFIPEDDAGHDENSFRSAE